MKKVFSLVLFMLLFGFAWESRAAGWEYCRYSVQQTSDSWDVYVQKRWTGPGPVPPGSFSVQYRVSTISGGVLSYSPWMTLPSGTNNRVGSVGMGGGVVDVQIRIPALTMPGSPPQYTIYTLVPCS